MKSKKCQEDSKRIVEFYLANNQDRILTNKVFLSQGIKLRTIQRTLKRWNEERKVNFSLNSGPKRSALSEINLNKIKKQYVNSPSTSVRQIAAKIKVSHTSVQRSKKILNIKTRKKIIAPKYQKDQAERCKINSKKLLKIAENKIFVLDDETYVPLDPSDCPGNDFYNEINGIELSIDNKLKLKAKFSKKYLVWQAISQDGKVSETFITTDTMNGKTYKKECVPRLIRFIDTLGGPENVVFWPDMATAYYDNKVTEALRSANIQYVQKKDNLPNCPQLRPIEKF